MKVPLLTLDKPNLNNRIYPRAVWEKAVKKYEEDYINKNRAVVLKRIPDGETINIQDTIGIVKEIKTEGDTVFAEVQFLNVPDRIPLQQALQSGDLSLRSHGIGTLKEQADGTYIVGEDYEIISCFLTHE